MWFNTKTTIGFTVPDECEVAWKFIADHPDFQVSETGSVIWCYKSEIYQTENPVTVWKEDEDERVD